MAAIVEFNEIIDGVILSYQSQLGSHYAKYRNHVYRVFNLAIILSNPDQENTNAIAIAAAFHDLGIWTANTFDYLAPSIALARKYLAQNNLLHLEPLVIETINNHHKLSAYKSDVVVEAFRKADLIDLSFGLIKFGMDAKTVKALRKQFPSSGFHRFIIMQALKNTARHPLNPLPMMGL